MLSAYPGGGLVPRLTPILVPIPVPLSRWRRVDSQSESGPWVSPVLETAPIQSTVSIPR